MDQLPPELVDMVVESCEHETLKNVRLVSKHFQRLATPLVFEHFSMCALDPSEGLEKLKSIAKSPLSKHIRTFTVATDILPRWGYPRWRKAVTASKRSLWLNKDYTEAELEVAYKEFDAVRRMAHGPWRDHLEGLMFKEMFAMLPNVVEARATVATKFHGVGGSQVALKRLQDRILVGPIDWIWDSESDYREDYPRARNSAKIGLSLLEAIGYRAAFAGTKQIEKLTLCIAHHTDATFGFLMGNTQQTTLDIEQTRRLNLLLEGFGHLTELDLQCRVNDSNPLLRGTEALEKVLRTCRNLRRFALNHSGFGVILTALSRSGCPWPHIEHFSLTSTVRHDQLLDFLKLLSPSLKSFEISDSLVFNVQELLKELPRVLNLENVSIRRLKYLSGVHGRVKTVLNGDNEKYEQALKAYLLREQDDYPKMEEDLEEEFNENLAPSFYFATGNEDDDDDDADEEFYGFDEDEIYSI